jgi:hypothetical protein
MPYLSSDLRGHAARAFPPGSWLVQVSLHTTAIFSTSTKTESSRLPDSTGWGSVPIEEVPTEGWGPS